MNRIAYVGINKDKGISQQKWDDLRCSHEKRHMFAVSRKNHLNDPGDWNGFRVFEFIVNIKKTHDKCWKHILFWKSEIVRNHNKIVNVQL